MEGGEPSYYAILNVPPDASEADIRRSYRQLAQIFHPDKHSSAELRSRASEGFASIAEAYEVLSNPQKRQVYDIYGKQGLVAGLDVGTKLKSVEELRKQWEKFRAQQDADNLDGTGGHQTYLHCTVDARGLFGRNDPDESWAPTIGPLYVQSTVAGQMTSKGMGWFGGNMMVRKEGVGGGNLICGWKGVVAPDCILETNASWGMKPMVQMTTTQELTEHMSATLTTSWSDGDGVGLELGTSRYIASNVRGNLTCQLGPPSHAGMNLSFSRHGEKSVQACKVQVGAIYSMSGRFNYSLTEDTMARAVVKFGLTGIDMELGAVRQPHPHSTVSVGVVFGLQGTLLRIKFTRSGTTFDIPIVLSRDYKDWQMALCAYTLPPLIFAAVRHFVWRPLRKRLKRQEALKSQRDHVDLVRERLASAAAAQRLLAPVAARKSREERVASGLVIVHAEYGVLDAAGVNNWTRSQPGQAGPAVQPGEGLPPLCVDVTLAIQYLLNDGRVQLHDGVTKSGLMGFCDPAPGQEKALRVRYLWKGQPYCAEVDDTSALELPSDGKAVMDLDEADCMKRMATEQDGETSGVGSSTADV
eukprot:evm.model.scf_402.4 EVM.evm.TU.scf_402.4   scf_402:39651-45159(+)